MTVRFLSSDRHKGDHPMRNILCSIAFLLAMTSSQAAEEAKPNTLTPKEVADGWILLFDGDTTFGWQVQGEAKVADGTLILGGPMGCVLRSTCDFGAAYDLRFDCRWEGKATGEGLREPYVSVHMRDGAGSYFALLEAIAGRQGWHGGSVSVKSDAKQGAQTVQMKLEKHHSEAIWRTGSLQQVIFGAPAGTKLFLRNVKLKPLGLKPIFNGKDLTGWKEFPGRKSKFSVTPEGWINIKNGPGDLQTEGQWGDFILQIDCFSNGDRLNSGVFFRCIPDQYQQGYEAQIHNGFLEPPGKEYILEEYDPKTHKVVNKKKVVYTAMDYGTGAIYRRQPARFQVAKDREWFTMTVIAHGNHMAVWVNGIEVTDWTDNRPTNDNARNGCKLEKGPISLQGHDPTTDLNFRNIRIAELPKGSKRG
jgi:hypothetical protein